MGRINRGRRLQAAGRLRRNSLWSLPVSGLRLNVMPLECKESAFEHLSLTALSDPCLFIL